MPLTEEMASSVSAKKLRPVPKKRCVASSNGVQTSSQVGGPAAKRAPAKLRLRRLKPTGTVALCMSMPMAKKRPRKPVAKKRPQKAVAKKRPKKSETCENWRGLQRSASSDQIWKLWLGRTKYYGHSKKRSLRMQQISRRMIRVLRHKANALGLHIRPDGFCSVKELLSTETFMKLNCTTHDLQVLVRTDDKQRFDLGTAENGDLVVRAAQGHSIDTIMDDSLLRPLVKSKTGLPEVCVHGTYRKHLDGILSRGLVAGGRRHVHFSPFEPGDKRVISGMRNDSELAIYVDLCLALDEGIPFFWSSNSVILSPGVDGRVPAKYVQKIWDIQQRCWLAETPGDLRWIEAMAERICEPAAKKMPMKLEAANRPTAKKMPKKR